MYHVLYFSLCIFTLYFPCFAFFVIDPTRHQTLLIKRFNFAFIEDRPSVSQSNVQAVTAENKEQYTLSNIIEIKFPNSCFLYVCFEGGAPKMKTNQLKDTCNGGIYKEFLDILHTFISQKTFQWQLLTVVRFSKYSFPKKLQYIFRAGDYSLRKVKILHVSIGSLIVLKWKNTQIILNIKYTAIYSKTWTSSLLYIQQRCIQNPIKHLSKKVTSLEVPIFTKSSILDV